MFPTQISVPLQYAGCFPIQPLDCESFYVSVYRSLWVPKKYLLARNPCLLFTHNFVACMILNRSVKVSVFQFLYLWSRRLGQMTCEIHARTKTYWFCTQEWWFTGTTMQFKPTAIKLKILIYSSIFYKNTFMGTRKIIATTIDGKY